MNEARPLPPGAEIDEVSRPFWEAAREGRLLVQRCADCSAVQLGVEMCVDCFGERLEWIDASGRATVHTFTVMHLRYHPAFEAPYAAAVVELDEGPRLPVRVPDHVALQVGQRVSIAFVPSDTDVPVPVARAMR